MGVKTRAPVALSHWKKEYALRQCRIVLLQIDRRLTSEGKP
jgi:hypothetical protein